MGFRLTEDEAWAMIAGAHTAIVTTLRRDGRPIALPTWLVVLDGAIYIQTPAGSKKLTRIRTDPRAHLLVESGDAWAELTAVSVEVHASIVHDDATAARALAALAEKYADFTAPQERLPDAVKATYSQIAVVRLDAIGRLNSWNNSALVG
jgi:PPOX class probable F420-dependent enzyme